MDRISTLRNVEDALSRYEEGELTLPELEQEVRGTLRTYATDFEDGRLYRARGDAAADGLVVVADSQTAARERVTELLSEPGEFDIERAETG
jgi:hypothetical protein